VALILGWWLVAHSSGQGWVQALGDMVTAGVLVGVVGPWPVLRRIRVEVVSGPIDATAGSPIRLSIRSSGPARLTALHPGGRGEVFAAGAAKSDSGTTEVVVVAHRHGVIRSVNVEVATAAPFGLQWWSRKVELALPRPIHVAPRRGRPHPIEPLVPDDQAGQEGGGRAAPAFGDLRAPRPYRPEDSRRLVHWPATAHAGELMVRDVERPVGRPAELVVKLPADPDAAEAEAERAMATVGALLDRGVPVMLTTSEIQGAVTAVVRDYRAAGRRLAAAT
jgi:uncharacterized protein (DUF58 family)